MKKLIIIPSILFSVATFAQSGNVGVNTSSPARTLHVQGDLVLTQADVKTSPTDALYNRVLVKDATNGNIDEVPLSAFQSYTNSNAFAGKYVDLTPDRTTIQGTSAVALGCLEVRFDKTSGGDGQMQFRVTCNDSHVTKKSRYWSIASALGFFNYSEFDVAQNVWTNLELLNYNVSTTENIQLGIFNKTTKTTEIYNLIVTSNNSPAEMMISLEKY